MAAHAFHPAATKAGLLSPYCGECQHKILADLDDEHFEAIVWMRKKILQEVMPPQLWAGVLQMNALEVQTFSLQKRPDREAVEHALEADEAEAVKG